uniref:Uncharacterized protein n=1 Tax=Avena sativa TaxID=4498 RepID=A0ACD5WLA1_AVESA
MATTWLDDIENKLPVKILVLFSLGIQFILFFCAGVRRREASGCLSVVRVRLLWLAYNLSDNFATFTLGRLAFSSANKGKHRLDPLWAPFLLLHLAGPDNIAAYALQDNELSLRSLQTVLSQVIAGLIFLYRSRESSGHFVRLASWVMFAVGVVKYWERWLALQRGNLGNIRDSLKKQPPPSVNNIHAHREDVKLKNLEGFDSLDEESSVRRAHSLFYICKSGMVDSGMVDSSEGEPAGRQKFLEKMEHVEWWTIVEIELSLMYDILYTKAAVIHTRQGYTIRVISPLAILTSLLLFLFSEEYRDSKVLLDTATTYVLFGSALFIELSSLLNAVGSSWMFATLSDTRSTWLRYTFLCSGRWHRLRSFLVPFGGRIRRRWSGHMGQYNMLHFCTRPDTRPLLGMVANWVGFQEWWNRKHFSGATKISKEIKRSITNQSDHLFKMGMLSTLGMIELKWGMKTLKIHQVVKEFEGTLGSEFQEGIIIWHIGTDFFLSECNTDYADDAIVKAIKALSNYMMFLLVERPYMLPGIAHNKLYERTCELLLQGGRHQPTGVASILKSLFSWHDEPDTSARATHTKKHANGLYNHYVNLNGFTLKTVRLTYSATVAEQLLIYKARRNSTTESLKLLLQVWVDMLVYAGNKCSRESHAKKLGSGMELTSIVWLLLEHFNQAALEHRALQELKQGGGI